MNSRPILLVEDDENDVIFMQHAWKKAEAQVPLRVVTDGQSAIDYLSGAGPYADRRVYPLPRLVLMDIQLHGMSGLEVLQWIREHPAFRTLIVIVMSSSAAATDVHRAYSLGANSFVTKPASPQMLREFVEMIKRYWTGWNLVPPDGQESPAPQR